jgi:lipoyl(octanoyl) transferase
MNMAIDYYLAQNLREIDDPVLRFYGWDPYCLSLGFHQDVGEVNLTAVQKNQIDLVRRPTGGSAVFHSEELTYSLVMPVQRVDHQELFQRIHQLIYEALRVLGYAVQLHAQKEKLNYLKEGQATFVCFNRPAFTEIKINGKKCVGSAQKLFKQSILQHGCILVGEKQFEIVQYLKGDQQYKNNISQYLKENSTCLNDKNPVAYSPFEFSESIIDKFQTHGAYQSYYQLLGEKELETIQTYQRLFDLNHLH